MTYGNSLVIASQNEFSNGLIQGSISTIVKSSATITRSNVGNGDEYSMSYKIKDATNEKKLVDLKLQMDKLVVKAGGQTVLDEKNDEADSDN